MNKKYQYLYKMLLLALVLIFSTSCGKKLNTTLENTEEISVYFVNVVDGKLSTEQVVINTEEINTNEKKLKVAIEAIQKGPQATNLLPVLIDNVTIKDVELKEESTKVHLSKEYENLSVQKQMVLRASVVRTLTDLPFISSVEFIIEQEPLTGIDGEVIGPIFKDDIVLVQPDPKPPTKIQNITLYFFHNEKEGLVAENRQIQVNNNVPLERYILEELIKGPQNENYIRTIPEETKINDVKTKDGVCQVDLSIEFKSKHSGGSAAELYTIYSIVNSLTESSPKVKKVAFLIDGKKQIEFKGHLDLSILFERDESLIAE